MASESGSRILQIDQPSSPHSTPSYNRVSISDKENTPQDTMKTSRNGTPILSSSNGRLKGQFKIMSDAEIAVGKFKESVGKNAKTAKRRSLAPLQQSVEGKDILTGHGRESRTIKDAFLKKKNNKITEERVQNQNEKNCKMLSQNAVSQDTKYTTDETIEDPLVRDALALMKSTENANEGYWKSMAEERRLALEEVLNENEELYDEIDKLKIDNEQMKGSLKELECYKLLYFSLKDQISTSCTTNDNEENETVA